jgi:antirestriction protein ArdC
VVLLWMTRTAGYRTPRFLTFKEALELGGHVRKGEHGTKVYFVKQLEVKEDANEIGEVGLPDPVGCSCLVLELVGSLDDNEGWAGNQVMGLQEPINR